jgi:hypothetical protein
MKTPAQKKIRDGTVTATPRSNSRAGGEFAVANEFRPGVASSGAKKHRIVVELHGTLATFLL